jgi:hypothetical protein
MDCPRRALCMDCPVSAMERTSANLTKILDERPRVREIDVIQEGERGRPFCASEFSPAQDPFVADSSQLFRIVRIESRRAQFVTAPRLGQWLLPDTSEVTILIDVPKSYRLRGWEAQRRLPLDFRASGPAERRAARHLCRFALAFMRLSATKRKTSGP